MTDIESTLNNLVKPGESVDWVSLYEKVPAESLPWYSKELDQDLALELKKREIKSGRFLDLGTGPGTQAIELARRGFDVTGSDISGPGIEKAKKRAGDINHLAFVVDNIISTKITATFDYIFDRGCFHVIDSGLYDSYLKSIGSLLKKDGLLFLKCFAEGEEMPSGPKCFNSEKIATIFSKNFEIISIGSSEFLANCAEESISPAGHKALFVVMKRHSYF